MPEAPRVDVVNTFRVSAGHFAYFRVISRADSDVSAGFSSGFDCRQLHERELARAISLASFVAIDISTSKCSRWLHRSQTSPSFE
jgi:hypothetical protein